MNLMEGEVDIENNILVSDISVKSVFTLYIFVFISIFISKIIFPLCNSTAIWRYRDLHI